MENETTDFIRQRIQSDIEGDVLSQGVVTRFPPEPNGFLHIGHAKSICLNFGVSEQFSGTTFLRFDDTNPQKESEEFVESIKADVAWLGFSWGALTHASDYFEQIYQYAVDLISNGKAYVCSLDAEQMRISRGTLTEPGTNSPYRDRSVEDNLDLFQRMRAGEFADGEHIVRLKIDMASPNINLRDPAIYRIRHIAHQRTGDAWCIYPMYDFTHCICDALEGISHSLCTLEFEDHRPLYDWVLDNIELNYHPPQIEFSRLGLEYTVMSKRLLHRLVDEKLVSGWDDPRMPTIAGLRRRGVRAAAIRDFCARIGITKQDNTVEMNLLDFCIRKDLESSAPRGMGVLEPLKVVLTNFQDDIELEGPWHPQNADLGTRKLPFSRELWIEQSDFSENPPGKWKRLSPGEMVRLRYAFIIRCDGVEYDGDGNVVQLNCTYFPDSKSGEDTSGLKPKGVVHWVDAKQSVAVEVRDYDRLFNVPSPSAKTFIDDINEQSLTTLHAMVEPAMMALGEQHFQFERQGYFCKDSELPGVFNKTVSLREGF
ncbi:MAG: glutamine--tRNA ligase/YqeY domain fusion protein [Gammaproteobacteria bacterium]|jgi:glutaminyl-tRNA synthetase|nr:glutamine--tRNA ligase/YqeY domain fusion protein [Gammaproteobacteria bacterium]MBT3696816.1 glutamine--tRNA ligase/YqeY domain fusion protein [Gammaproteobacteria bacterium]MBT5333779.1 glutamine--tRNA ligase/YqeY domain fusion protein [Gammaproteobacteria bacterium]MBT5680440.1 glutamine--tRNA ligase/YqeY domain fusion protein [Gammaproteobacteria bacterium]MBT6558060.1 glutamine--tRNA ligase/YqeY domain fusion protein [Gammaproteobacteria bacterium]